MYVYLSLSLQPSAHVFPVVGPIETDAWEIVSTWRSFMSFLRCPCLPLGMFSVAVHCLMLPSQRTLQLMATLDDGNSNIAWLEAPLGSTVPGLVLDVLGHLC